jgi:nanoRNase/pAp phosphatase (c-di-AMP/oligoRNAs hydrolase)
MDHKNDQGELKVTLEKLQALHSAAGAGPLLVMTHDNPDPDALASGAALAALLFGAWDIQVDLGFSGLVARAENKAMHRILTPEWKPLEDLPDLSSYPAHALVDTQPGAGNNSLPTGFIPKIVFDHHHPIRDGLEAVPFLEIRTEMGATSSIVFLYLEAAGIELNARLATAVFYGIQADTQGLSRGGAPVDQEIYFKLLSRLDRQKLNQVAQARLPKEYFKAFNDGLKAARVYGKAVVAYLGPLHRPDFVAEMADSLIRLEDVQAVLCMGYLQDTMYLSLRTPAPDRDAGLMIQRIIPQGGRAGGHGSMAGGQIHLQGKSPDRQAAKVQASFLELMGESDRGLKLIS